MKPSEIETNFNSTVGGLRHAMRLIAIWPKTQRTLTMTIIWFFYLTGFTVCISASFAGAIMMDKDFERTVAGLGQTIPMTVITIKYGLVKGQLGPLKYVLKSIEEDWKVQEKGSRDDRIASRNHGIMTTHARMSRIFFNTYTAAVMICWILFTIAPITRRTSPTNQTTTTINEFPMSSWYPMSTHLSPTYEIIYLSEIAIGIAMVIAHTSIDSLLVMSIFHLCGQLEILRCCIEESGTTDEDSRVMSANVKFIVERHLSIVNVAGAVEESFNHILLGQLLAGTLAICLAGFSLLQAMESNNVTALVRFGFLLTIALQQMFIYSFAGDYLTSQGALIRIAVFNAHWYVLPPWVGKAFLLVMIRAAKPITITAGKFFPMSLINFTGLLKSSASYLSVMRAMNTDNAT